MTFLLEELDYQQTPLGDISLRRRSEPRLNDRVLYEVKLGDEFLMSSLFTEAEVALATLGLATQGGDALDVVVGGLGLGYTAAAVLDHPKVRSLRVIDVMQPVIDWHRRGLVPLGSRLSEDPRCQLVHADFFALATGPDGFGPEAHAQRVHAVLLDIDHSPRHWLAAGNAGFYSESALTRLAEKIRPGGVFGLWSNDPPDETFSTLLERVFIRCQARVIRFANPYSGGASTNTVYLAQVP